MHADTVRCVSELTGRLCWVLLAGEEPHDVPVAGEDTELHQISKHTQNLQQELLKREIEKRKEAFESLKLPQVVFLSPTACLVYDCIIRSQIQRPE